MARAPLLFQPDMVRAVLADRKRQTRRLHRLGDPGDVLWMKESYRLRPQWDTTGPAKVPHGAEVFYPATWDRTADDGFGWGKLRPSIFMCMWMSRQDLLLTDVREQPLQAITEEDAIAEGIVAHRKGGWHWEQPPAGLLGTNHFGFKTARDAFMMLWESINGRGSWADNPTVFAHTFERVT